MEYTGERFVPLKNLLTDETAFEHFHRYYHVCEFIKDKIVVDIACGEGYGTSILANTAKKVYGIDIDSFCIEHAKKKYSRENIEFFQGSVTKIDLPANSVDILISFETIEHLDEKEQNFFIKEAKRILKKNGKLIISTPDKENYSERYSYKNEFHKKEFTKKELYFFLKKQFKYISSYSQGYEIVDTISGENPDELSEIKVCNWDRQLEPFIRKYLISICSNSPIEKKFLYSSMVFQVNKDFWQITDRIVKNEAHILELGEWGRRLDKEVEEKNDFIRIKEKELSDSNLEREKLLKDIRLLKQKGDDQQKLLEKYLKDIEEKNESIVLFARNLQKTLEQGAEFQSRMFEATEKSQRLQEELLQKDRLLIETDEQREKIQFLKDALSQKELEAKRLIFESEQQKQNFEQQITETNSILKQQSNTIQILTQENNEKLKNIEQLQKDKAQHIKTINELTQKTIIFENLQKETEALHDRNNAFRNEIEGKNSILKQQIITIQDLIEKNDGQFENIKQLQKEKEAHVKAINELAQKNVMLNDMQIEAGVLHSKNEILEIEIEEMNFSLEQQSNTIINLKEKYNQEVVNVEKLKAIIADNDKIIIELKLNNKNFSNQLDAVNVRLSEIYQSEGWKFLKKYYNIKGKLLPEKSRRYNTLKKIVNKLRGKKDQTLFSENKQKLPIKDTSKEEFDNSHEIAYDTIELPVFNSPLVSIVLPAYNGWDLTYKCLRSIKTNTTGIAYEVIIGDDASTDETKNIKEYINNVVVVRNKKNLEFLHNCNNAATYAKGKYILFLNNDTEVQPNWLSSMVDLMEKDEGIGMVGSKLIYPDGKLQEAGAIIWKDASGWNFGHKQDPDAPEFNYVKEADYISGASIVIRADLWKKIGGFDTRYAPAYSEDSDLAFEVRKYGYKVIYQPLSVVIHYEGYTHGTDSAQGIKEGGIKGYQKVNAVKFYEKWKMILDKDHFPNGENVFWARDKSHRKKTILVIDHYVPHFDKDAGSRTTFQLLELFSEMNYNVKFIGDNFYRHEPYTTILQQMGIEVLYGPWYRDNWQNWILDNHKSIDFVYINRPHISIKYIDFLKENTNAKIVYYGHDLHFVRELRQYEIENDPKLLDSMREWEKTETYIVQRSDTILTLSCEEKEIIENQLSASEVKIIPAFFYDKFEGPIKDFSSRKSILFVGGFNHKPNVDAIIWFVKEVWPRVEKVLYPVEFIIVGSSMPQQVLDLASERILVKGYVTDEDLNKIYATTRIVVIPLRYGAGVKGKTVEAMSKGIPIVTTSFGIEGLQDIQSVLVPLNDPTNFSHSIISLYNDENKLTELSKNEIEYAKAYFSKAKIKDIIAEVF